MVNLQTLPLSSYYCTITDVSEKKKSKNKSILNLICPRTYFSFKGYINVRIGKVSWKDYFSFTGYIIKIQYHLTNALRLFSEN